MYYTIYTITGCSELYSGLSVDSKSIYVAVNIYYHIDIYCIHIYILLHMSNQI